MATGSVTVNHLNLIQGGFPEIERQFLYIGVAGNADYNGKVLQIGADTDLDELLGASASDLKTQIEAARVNGGQNWTCSAVPIATGGVWGDDLATALNTAMEQNTRVESAIYCPPASTAAHVNAAYAEAMGVLGTYQRFITIGLTVSGIDAATETWADYIARITPVVDSVAGNRVYVVPQLHGNNIGVLAGRLCNRAASIADSPMRVNTGPLIALGDAPVDMNGAPLTMAHLNAMDQARFSVPQWYPDYPGTYWADCNLLDVPGGDYQVIENMRVLDYLARRVRLLAIARVADRKLNNTPASIEFNKTYFMRPLREASKAIKFAGIPFPAMIMPPGTDDIAFNWPTRTEVEIYIQAQPYNCPKKITVNLMLDLSGEVS